MCCIVTLVFEFEFILVVGWICSGETFTWVGLISGWSLACGLGLIVDWDDISEHSRHFRHFHHSAVSPCPLGLAAVTISSHLFDQSDAFGRNSC